jgi:hypothetical protein
VSKAAPNWLSTFHDQWQAARGRRTSSGTRGFSRGWEALLADAGIVRAEDQATALREAELLEKSGHLLLKRHKFRHYLVERIRLPVEREDWLRGLFGKPAASELLAEALRIVADFRERAHPRFGAEWRVLCGSLQEWFSQGRSLRPFLWSEPAALRRLLEITFALSSREWPPGTLVRAASVEIGLESKALGRHRRGIESALGRLLGGDVDFRALGLVSGDSMVELSGPLCLHFPDGSSQSFDELKNINLSAGDLARCVAITTSAGRLLSIENKTTFLQCIAANTDRRTLLAMTSYPSPAFVDLLEKLPADLPHHHFGDTDPAGWHILMKLRQAHPRGVAPFRMRWRPATPPEPLTAHDRELLPKLLAAPQLRDVWSQISALEEHQDRGVFEQESLGPPQLAGWPFYQDDPQEMRT